MNLDFFNGVKLRFGMGLDSGPLLDHVPFVGEQRVGPRGLLAELERSLGLPSVEFGAMDRTSMTRELLSRSHLGKDPFWRQSFEVDPLAVADDLLHVRDELTLAGWNFVVDDSCPRRLRDLAELPWEFAGLHGLRGLADRYLAVVHALTDQQRRAGLPGIAAVECAEARATLPGPWARLLQLIEAAGIPVYEKCITVPFQEMGERHRLVKVLNGEQDEEHPVHIGHERDLFVVRGGTVSECVHHLVNGALGGSVHGNRQAVIAPRASSPLAAAYAHAGLPAPRTGADHQTRSVVALIRLLPVLLFSPMDVERLAEFLYVRPHPLGASLAFRLLKAVIDRPGTGSKPWTKVVAELDDTERDRYHAWFGLPTTPELEACPADTAVRPFSMLASWARKMSHLTDGPLVNWQALSATCDRIVDQISKSYPDGLTHLQLDRLIARLMPKSDGAAAQAGSVPVATSAGELDTALDWVVWLPFCDCDPSSNRLYEWLREDERVWLSHHGVEIEAPENRVLRGRAEVSRIVSLAKTVWLLVPDADDGAPVAPHPVYSFLASRQNEADFVRPLEEFITSLPEIDPVQAPAPLPEWRLRSIPTQQLDTSVSFSRLNKLLTMPHAWITEYAARLTTGFDYAVPAGNLLYGVLAHDLAEAWFSRDDWDQQTPDDFSTWYAKAFSSYVAGSAVPLLRPGREAERERVRAAAHDGIRALDLLLREHSWRPAASESDLKGSLDGYRVHGRADLLCTTEQGEAITVVIDLKWTGQRKRRDEVDSGAAWQLAFYASIAGSIPEDVTAAYYILDRSRLIPLSAGDPMAETVAALIRQYRTRRDEVEEGRVVLPAPDEMEFWDPYRFLVGWGR